MGEDFWLSVFLSALVIALAVYGGVLAVPPREGKQRSRHHVWAFVVMGLLAFGISVRQSYRALVAGEEVRTIVQKTGKTVEELKSTQRESTEEKVQLSSHNREVREQLGRFVEEGLRIRAVCSPGNDAGRKGWESRIRTYLRQNLDSSYRARFKASLFPSGNCFQEVSGQIAILQKFIEELRD
jgi:hypothetical protein